ncbi:Serine/threonine-protein kinase tor2 [Vanrija pseudolonga]|uniref:Serine/threonine-protein kinase TOR n=1 Tax=Vanrija pseudolonga TaxID=143232 RepID=A0AAF0YCZ0_9TREE|nr:Serine/threonine-protein kinase tor2 [Vanrija pseudolonga]
MASQSDVLDSIFARLGSKADDVRVQAAQDLKAYIDASSLESPGDDSRKNMWKDVFPKTFDLSRSNYSHERLGAILAIDSMLEATNNDTPDRALQNNIRLYGYLRPLLNYPDSAVMVSAARVVGNMVRIAGINLGESFFTKEVNQALQMIDDTRQEVSRFSAVLLLHQFADNSPGLFMPFVPRVLDKIWVPLRDSRTMVRERASMLLSACLDIIKTRETKSGNEVYRKIFEEAKSGLLKAASVDSILGSLLAFGAMLQNQQLSMGEFFHNICDITLKYRDSKETVIRKAVIGLIPSMATYDSEDFEVHYLHRSMSYLLQALQRPTDRDIAYIALGHMSVQLASKMRPFIDDIVKIIKEHLRQKGKKNAPFEAPIFQSLAMLTTAVGPMLTRQMHEILDLMFPWGLSDALYHALEVISGHIPPLLRTIQDRLLETLSMILTGHSFRPLGAPAPRGKTVEITRDSVLQASGGGQAPETIVLALKILGNFDFSGHTLNEFVREAALPYLEHDSAEVRKEAVLASTQLFVNDPICHQTSSHSIEIVNDVLEKLLTVGITDQNPSIRQAVLENLDEKFDRHLSQAEDIRCLFVALNDEEFKIRELAIGIIGRLAHYNPAYVMPSLRKSLINLITELEYSTNNKQKEESAKLLCLLIGASAGLVKSYASTILSVVLRIARSPSTPAAVAASCVTCIGELAKVAGEELVPNVKTILDLVLEMLNDPASASKRDAALKTLGQVVSNTGEVIAPYIEHPQLLGILFRFLRTETSQAIRLETIRTMGMLGALDPFKHRLLHGAGDDPNAETSGPRVTDITLLMNTQGPSNDDYYQTVVINSLVNVLNDANMKEHHYDAINSVMLIFRTQRLRCVSFLPQILPAFLGVIRLGSRDSQDVFLKQLAQLITIVKQHIRNYLNEVFALVHDFWNPNSTLQITIISLVEAIARAVEGEFKAYLPQLLQQILRSFDGDLAARHISAQRLETLLHILKAFYVFGSSIEDYLHLVLPVIVRSFENPAAPPELRKAALMTTSQLCRKVNFSDHASQIIHPLVRTLSTPDVELRNAAMETLCVLVLQFGPDYSIFIPMVNKALLENKIVWPAYDQMVTKLLNRERLPPDLGPVEQYAADASTDVAVSAEQHKLPVNQQQLKAAWDCSNVTTRKEWLEWLKKLGVELMRESPSQAIRACTKLADQHLPFARELFNVAFVSCWTELYESYQEDLVHNIEQALTNTTVPSDVVNAILNLAEFMEHDEKQLAIEPRLLGDYATAFHAYAKALHYKEQEFFVDASTAVVEDLISVNQKLQQSDAAWGTLEYAQNNLHMTHDVLWYEKLGRWEEALVVWNERAADPDSTTDEATIAMGKLQALHALGEWEELAEFVQIRWPNAAQDEKKLIAPLAAAASWALYQWDLMDDYISAMKNDSADRNFFKAILAVHRNQFSSALRHITKARERLDGELTSLTGESYGRAYDVVVRVQMLSELEEIIAYKDHADQPERQATQRKTWQKRLEGCRRDVEVWQRILQLRSLVLTPSEDMDTWIHFADLCRTSDRLNLAEKTLTSLVGSSCSNLDAESRSRAPPPIVFAYYRLKWAQAVQKNSRDDRYETLAYLRDFTAALSDDMGLGARNEEGRLILPDAKMFGEYTKLLARCHVELGSWQAAMGEQSFTSDPSTVLNDYSLATELDPTWYQAWHTWALANFEVITQLEVSQQGLSSAHFTTYIIPAVEGFLRSIALSPGNSLQDTLRLLTLWFTYGYQHGVSQAISQGMTTVNVDVWLEVIPQIIARIQTPRVAIQQLIVRLLHDIGRAHPQALIYPLTVASKSNVHSRRSVAQSITAKMREHSATIVDQAELVSTELIRAAILWHEQWHEGLEDASKHYFAEHNEQAMFEVLEPLHDMIERGPETLRETSFVQSFGHELKMARDFCRRYRSTGDTNELNQAWDIYYSTFQRLTRQIKLLNVIELQYVSPKLMAVRDLELAVPGTYQSGKPVIGIGSVRPTFNVITSKQRPRRFTMLGRDGKEYTFLLKGHEDLRQDERVMQLFGLVNTLLSADQESAKRHLFIHRFSITPLSPSAGLLGWIPHSDTLHTLIKAYRESRKILLDIENRLMNQMADDNYDSLPLMHKVEVFQYALDNTTGQDLYRILWLGSRNSEAWLERRTAYTRSLALTSMIGYILGLGDRHPSNLMLDSISGDVIHIDFGDCFEVAMQRDKYPEKVPFRLTRMLIHAMEVCGITGTFSRSCEVSMEVMRDNKESLMAVLEAFVYDPLINWRLTAGAQPGGNRATQDVDERQYPGRGTGRGDERDILNEADRPEVMNDKALQVIERVRRKLTGRDFKPNVTLGIKEQVEELVAQAINVENLCVAFVGWCSFW